MASVDPLEGEGGNLAFANRWTFYIDKSGKVAYIEKTVNPATSAEDMLAKLAQLNVSTSR